VKIVGATGRDDVAVTRIAELRAGHRVEFVESVDPPTPRRDKWVLIISTMFGCPVGCLMCDAGGHYRGRLTADEMLGQIDYMVKRRFPDGHIPIRKFKIQFARMGEPSLNPAVLEVLETLPRSYRAAGLMPSVSTVAPLGGRCFFGRLVDIKDRLYSGGRFQLQFSIHTTDDALRDRLIPTPKWDLSDIAAYGSCFHCKGDRKITLNAALAEGMPLDADVLLSHFDPAKFLIKITPLNPTYQARRHRLSSYVAAGSGCPETEGRYEVVERLRSVGFEVLVSIGQPEENLIGSNCGQFLTRHLLEEASLRDSYTYTVSASDHSPRPPRASSP
jgi:23S rRNA (adenine2503-C2)-methyltransferase